MLNIRKSLLILALAGQMTVAATPAVAQASELTDLLPKAQEQQQQFPHVDQVAPAETTSNESAPKEISKESAPKETSNESAPSESSNESAPSETSNESTPSETSNEQAFNKSNVNEVAPQENINEAEEAADDA